MRDPLPISDLTFTSASLRDRTRGLHGWLEFTVAGVVRIDGVAVRRTADGRTSLSFPSRTDRAGRRHAVVAPVDAAARLALEAALIPAITQLLPQEDVR